MVSLSSREMKRVRRGKSMPRPQLGRPQILTGRDIDRPELRERLKVMIMESEVIVSQRTNQAFHFDERTDDERLFARICQALTNMRTSRAVVFNGVDEHARIEIRHSHASRSLAICSSSSPIDLAE